MIYSGLRIVATVAFQEGIDTSQRELDTVRVEIERVVNKILMKEGLQFATSVDVVISAQSVVE